MSVSTHLAPPRRWGLLLLSLLLAVTAIGGLAAPAKAAGLGGPVILGGDDMTDHGYYDGSTGENFDGWLYIEKAIGNIKSQVTRSGADGSIAALGSADPGFDPTQFYSGDAGAAIASAGVKNAMPVTFYDDETAINQFFDALRAGTAKPSIIWISGDQAFNDLASNGGQAALTANATTLGDFVNSGGGLMSHGTFYDWLGGVLPGVSGTGCDFGGSDDLVLTTDGQAAFPGLTTENINAGPWHSCFEGDIGDLQVLVQSTVVTDSQNNPGRVIIGGAAVTIPGTIGLTPQTATNPVGTSHTVTATVRNGDGSARSGVNVSFSVTNGPDQGATGSGTTNASGQATFTYTNNGTPGDDTIEASFSDNGVVYKATATKTWEAVAPGAATIDLSPQTATNPVGTSHTVTATVKDGSGSPKSGVSVSFSVTAGPDQGATGSGTTNGSGQATFTYTNNGSPGDDTIQASFDDNGTTRSATATKTWEAHSAGPATQGTGKLPCGYTCAWRFDFDVAVGDYGPTGTAKVCTPKGTFRAKKITAFSVNGDVATFTARGTWKWMRGYRLVARVVDGSPDHASFKIYKIQTGALVASIDKDVYDGDITISS